MVASSCIETSACMQMLEFRSRNNSQLATGDRAGSAPALEAAHTHLLMHRLWFDCVQQRSLIWLKAPQQPSQTSHTRTHLMGTALHRNTSYGAAVPVACRYHVIEYDIMLNMKECTKQQCRVATKTQQHTPLPQNAQQGSMHNTERPGRCRRHCCRCCCCCRH